MAIEKMTFIDMTCGSAYLDEVLRRCLKSGMFQPEYASKLSEYSIGANALLRNPYSGLMTKINEIAASLDVSLDSSGFDGGSESYGHEYRKEMHDKLDAMREEYPAYFEWRKNTNDKIISYTAAVEMLVHIDEPEINFDELWENRYLKIRFGRMPTENLQKLDVYVEKPYELYKLDSNPAQTWCIYVTAEKYHDDIDEIFHDLGFERLRIPDYVHGTTESALLYLKSGLEDERLKQEDAVKAIEEYIKGAKTELLDMYSQIKFLHAAYDLRKFAVGLHESYHIVGFVLRRNEKEFNALFSDLGDNVAIINTPADKVERVQVPVRLKNNWFVKPFEMFVNMYGSPSYKDIDPSPFVAYTYSLFFGIMFGDLGQGFVVFVLGLLLWRLKRMPLGAIMSRIGVSSMFFGSLYGSVFGFEHLLDGFYTGVLGLHEKPLEVMRPDTTNMLLLAAIGLGAAIILVVIIFNIITGIKHRDFDRAALSHNGVAGLIFYSAVLAVILEYMTGKVFLDKSIAVPLIFASLIIIFLREPIANLIKYNSTGSVLKEKPLAETKNFQRGPLNCKELFECQFVAARFGRLPTDSFKKLTFFEHEPFILYPIKSEHDYIWCVYVTSHLSNDEIDAIFRDLLFERIFIPDEYLSTNEDAEAYIKRCVAAGGIPVDETAEEAAKFGPLKTEAPKTLRQVFFPEGAVGFFVQNFFEIFEIVLSFVTNTMSFLRIGGFVLAHAGMMTVVFTLAEMVGGGASPAVIILGNIFVIALEGLIVGIQALRLEFYEIFSRFFDAEGEPFNPVIVNCSKN